MDKKELFKLVDACVGYSLTKSYDMLTGKKKKDTFSNEYALVYCFFATLRHGLISQMKEDEK